MTAPTKRPAPAPVRPASTGARTGWIVGAVLALVVVLVAVIAVLASGGGGDEASSTTVAGAQETRPNTIDGSALPEYTGNPDAAIGMVAPTVSGAGFDGTPIAVRPGAPTLLVFLAHWCPHCQREVPVLTEWEAAGGVPEGVDVIGVATATRPDRPNYPPSAWLARERFPFPVIADDERFSIAGAFGLRSFPYFVMVDPQGRVTWRGTGEIEPDELLAAIATAQT